MCLQYSFFTGNYHGNTVLLSPIAQLARTLAPTLGTLFSTLYAGLLVMSCWHLASCHTWVLSTRNSGYYWWTSGSKNWRDGQSHTPTMSTSLRCWWSLPQSVHCPCTHFSHLFMPFLHLVSCASSLHPIPSSFPTFIYYSFCVKLAVVHIFKLLDMFYLC